MAFKIAIDAGHGINTAGKRCDKKLDANQTREWTLNDRVARYIAEAAKQYEGVETLRVDDVTGKKDVSLSARCKASNNWGADMYIACHHNAGIKLGTGGGIVAYSNKEGTKGAEYRDEIYKACIAAGGLKGNRADPTKAKSYYVVKNTKAPAVLMEYGFMDSQTDVPFILQDKYSKLVGYATMEGIAKVAELKKKSTPAKQEAEKTSSVKVDSAKSFNALKAGTYTVTANSLNLRSGASTDKQIIEAMAKGKTFTCYGYYTGSWLYGISASGKKGFCHKSYLKKK